jgi:hypothetical protein
MKPIGIAVLIVAGLGLLALEQSNRPDMEIVETDQPSVPNADSNIKVTTDSSVGAVVYPTAGMLTGACIATSPVTIATTSASGQTICLNGR